MPVVLEFEPHLIVVPAGTPARELTQATACAELKKFIADGKITVYDPGGSSDDSYEPEPRKKVAVKTADVCGVRLTFKNPSVKKTDRTGGLDLRMAVLLCRFTKFLKDKWDVTEVYHGGLGIAGKNVDDRHSRGCAMDFFGATTKCETTFMVDRDWGLRPIPGAGKSNIWPMNTTKFFFRLSKTTRAGMFFHHVYDYLTTQARDSWERPSLRTTIGMKSSIIHPDYPGSAQMRISHVNHIHFEVPWRDADLKR